MNDRELLEFAAKAAGFGSSEKGRTCWTESEYPRNSGKRGALWNYVGHMDTAELWNPLADDGDAHRLMVKLKMEFYQADDEGMASYASYRKGDDPRMIFAIEYHYDINNMGDPYAATRRAIVRAAAEIGKEMK
jgi:hypothetical protein